MSLGSIRFSARSTVETVIKILNSSYEALPETFSEDLRQLVTDTLQMDPKNRPSVSEILTRPFIIKHLHKMSLQTTEELYKTLDALRKLADGLETVHFNTTVSSLTGGVVGLAGGITSVVGVVLAPFTLGAPLIVTGVGIGVAVAGEVTAGVSNIIKMVKQCLNRQKIKMMITEFQEKIMSTICCIQNIQIAMETLESVFPMKRRPCSNPHARAKTELGQSLRVIPEIFRLHEVAKVRKVASQAEKAVRVAEAATRILSALFVAVDVFFVFLDSREIHNIRRDCALKESQRETKSTSKQTTFSTDQTSEHKDTTNLLPAEQELKSETMKFVTKIKETTEKLQVILDTLRDALHPN
ncbi:apolipoprotein L3-like [Megalobrama amblycephala]|uniref:apolipoprotein L3-like n=1 Tax=Megalobrama amblycephala TaxID=75352 RepID=UPI0020145C6F|nr:apolipoprotein L3-like [Megalobrama amblycephala]